MLRLLPSVWREVVAVTIESFIVSIFYRRPNIGKTPGDTLVVAHHNIRHPRQGHSSNIKVSRVQMRFIPEVGHLMAQMHVVRQQWFAGCGMSAGDNPVIGAYDEPIVAIPCIETIDTEWLAARRAEACDRAIGTGIIIFVIIAVAIVGWLYT